MTLTAAEAELIRRQRLTPAQQVAETQTRETAARTAFLAACAPEARARWQKHYDDLAAEQARVAALSPEERAAETLLRRQTALQTQLADVTTQLAEPAVAAVAAQAVDGKVPSGAAKAPSVMAVGVQKIGG
jgi:sigma54-dependent transcription regulator